MATAPQVSFCFFCDVLFWHQVWRTLLQYFQRYSWFSILPFWLHSSLRHHFPNFHNIKMLISLERKKIFQKGKCHSSVFWKVFQINSDYFSFHRHFKYLAINICIWGHRPLWMKNNLEDTTYMYLLRISWIHILMHWASCYSLLKDNGSHLGWLMFLL